VVAAVAAGLAVAMAACSSNNSSSNTSATSAAASSAAASSAAATTAASGTGSASSAPASATTGASSAASVDTGQPANANGTFVFGAAGAPATFDPLYATDGETFRVVRELMEGLVGFKPGTADIAPGLAESWTHTDDGLTWTFKIRQGVTFSDGTALDAAAVCYNLDRMYHQKGLAASLAQYWSSNMGVNGSSGFSPDPSVYKSCQAQGTNAVITLTRYTSKFPSILGLPSFSIQSPTALKKYDSDNVTGTGDSPVYPAYNDHPTGTGPYTLTKYDKQNQTITLTRNDNYWGTKAKSKTLIFQIIPDETARKQALQAGTIDGYDLPNPADWEQLKSQGFQVDVRPAFNILYLGFNFKNNKALQDIRVRQAIAYALNRQQFVNSQLPSGAEVALNWYPKTVSGWTDQVQQYNYDPAKAKQLLAAAGQSNLTVNFWWPTAVSRPYMPNPKAVFTALSNDLQAVGIKVNATSKDWNGGYLTGVTNHDPDLFLLGWTGDYNTPDNFLGSFFSSPATNNFYTAGISWGKTLDSELAKADSIPDDTQRNAAYVKINQEIMSTYMPGVPISHSPPAIVVASDVKGLIPSPLTAEDYSLVYKG
jgi:peptide/nickel transport system substrate-binding protein